MRSLPDTFRLPIPSKLGIIIENPYENVCWESEGRYRANYHAHTTSSDGKLNPHSVIDRYHALGYHILALTDHNAVVYPWTALTRLSPSDTAKNHFTWGRLQSESLAREDRNPEALGMIAIQGNELSSHHHLGSFFSGHNGTETEVDSLEAIGAKGGLAVLCHPGLYDHPATWYIDLYERFPHLVGLEVFNRGDRYPGDRAIWDTLLSALMPDRPIWGYSNDDMHVMEYLGCNYNVMLLPELSEEWVRRGMEQGRFYFVYNPAISDKIALPIIESIHVDAARGCIKIQAVGPREIVWISDGKEIYRGDEISLAHHPHIGNYVRAELRGENGAVVCTQPFGLPRLVRATLDIAAQPGWVDYTGEGEVRAVVHLLNRTDRCLTPKVNLRLDTRSLHREKASIEPGETLALPISLPASALNSGQDLTVEIDLGKEVEVLRRYEKRLPLTVKLPVEVEIDIPTLYYADIRLHTLIPEREFKVHADIRLHNLIPDQAFTVKVLVTIDGEKHLQEALLLPAGEFKIVRCALPAAVSGKTEQFQVTVQWPPDISPTKGCFASDIDCREITSMPRRTVAGDFSEVEWGKPMRTLNSCESVAPGKRRDRWQGPEDFSADLRWFCTDNDLWLAADVRDDHHVNNKKGEEIWNGDALQIGIAPVGVEAVNVALALTDSGVKFHQLFVGDDLTLMEQADYTVTRDDDKALTHYRLRLPLSVLGLDSKPGTVFGFAAVLFNDDDGKGYDFWMQTSAGVAGGWNPLLFDRFVLE